MSLVKIGPTTAGLVQIEDGLPNTLPSVKQWAFSTAAGPELCPPGCLTSQWTLGIFGWGSKIACGHYNNPTVDFFPDTDLFLVFNYNLTKWLQCSIEVRNDFTLHHETFILNGVTIVSQSVTSPPTGTMLHLSFLIPPGTMPTDITNVFSADYNCVCGPGANCRAGFVASAPVFTYV